MGGPSCGLLRPQVLLWAPFLVRWLLRTFSHLSEKNLYIYCMHFFLLLLEVGKAREHASRTHDGGDDDGAR